MGSSWRRWPGQRRPGASHATTGRRAVRAADGAASSVRGTPATISCRGPAPEHAAAAVVEPACLQDAREGVVDVQKLMVLAEELHEPALVPGEEHAVLHQIEQPLRQAGAARHLRGRPAAQFVLALGALPLQEALPVGGARAEAAGRCRCWRSAGRRYRDVLLGKPPALAVARLEADRRAIASASVDAVLDPFGGRAGLLPWLRRQAGVHHLLAAPTTACCGRPPKTPEKWPPPGGPERSEC